MSASELRARATATASEEVTHAYLLWLYFLWMAILTMALLTVDGSTSYGYTYHGYPIVALFRGSARCGFTYFGYTNTYYGSPWGVRRWVKCAYC